MIKHFFIFLMTICNFNSKESISHLIEKNNLKIDLKPAYSSDNPFKNIDHFVVIAAMPVQKSMLQKMNRLFEQKLGSYGTVNLKSMLVQNNGKEALIYQALMLRI